MTNPNDIRKTPSHTTVDRAIKTLMSDLGQETGPQPVTTAAGRLARLLKIYQGIRPLLEILNVIPLLPSAWRRALGVFLDALEAVNAGFKAGKDL